jgi:hypothetical protein
VTILGVTTGCGGGDSDAVLEPGPGVGVVDPTETAVIVATVRDTQGAPVANTAVTIYEIGEQQPAKQGDVVTTDAQGRATFDQLKPLTSYSLAINNPTYADQVANATTRDENQTQYVSTTLIERSDPITVQIDNGATIDAGEGLVLILQPGSFVNGEGEVVTGEIQAEITMVDVTSPTESAAMFGRLVGEQTNGESTPLYTFGQFEFHFTQNGDELQLGGEFTANLELPIFQMVRPNGDPVSIGDSIQLWSLDEVTGDWIEEGIVTVVASDESPTGLVGVGAVDHFSTWNVDEPTSFSKELRFELVNKFEQDIIDETEAGINDLFVCAEVVVQGAGVFAGYGGTICDNQLDEDAFGDDASVEFDDGVLSVVVPNSVNTWIVTPLYDGVRQMDLQVVRSDNGASSINFGWRFTGTNWVPFQ